jgi:hypothetical protein
LAALVRFAPGRVVYSSRRFLIGETMTAEELSSRVHRKPFRAVVIRMVDGARYPIVRSHSVAVMRTEAFVYFGRGDERKFIRLDQIAAVEDQPEEEPEVDRKQKGAVARGVTRQAVEDRLKRRPFESFRVNTSNGKHYDVTDPRLAIVTDARLFIVFEPNGWADVMLGEVVSLESVVE